MLLYIPDPPINKRRILSQKYVKFNHKEKIKENINVSTEENSRNSMLFCSTSSRPIIDNNNNLHEGKNNQDLKPLKTNMKINSTIISKNSSIKSKNKELLKPIPSNKQVRFKDYAQKERLVEVIEVESYKKYNNDDEFQKCDSYCCCIQ